MRWWSCAWVLLSACTEPEPEAPAPPTIEGTWNLRFTPMDTTCYPNLVAPEDLYDFLTQTAARLYVAQLDVSQAEARLDAALGDAGCVLGGSVGVGGVFTLTGGCDSATLGRALRLTGTATVEDLIDVAGNLRLDVDLDGDDAFDCVSDPVTVEGTGTPPL